MAAARISGGRRAGSVARRPPISQPTVQLSAAKNSRMSATSTSVASCAA